MKEKSQHRDTLYRRLFEDLVGPRDEDGALPTDNYLTGMLWPRQITMSGEDDDRLATAGGGAEDEAEEESSGVMFGVQKPSVAGISFSAWSEDVPKIRVDCCFATYKRPDKKLTDEGVWTRREHVIEGEIVLTPGDQKIGLVGTGDELPDAYLNVRCIGAEADGVVLVTLTLVNKSEPELDRKEIVEATLFQTSIRAEPCTGTLLVPKPPRRAGLSRSETDRNETGSEIGDEESGQLLYRNVLEFAVGHVCSAEWEVSDAPDAERPCGKWVGTTWIPSAIVEGVDPEGHKEFATLYDGNGFDPLSAKDLAWADLGELQSGLERFCDAYERWIEIQRLRLDDPKDVDPSLIPVGKEHISRCGKALERMRMTVAELGKNPRLLRSFPACQPCNAHSALLEQGQERRRSALAPFPVGVPVAECPLRCGSRSSRSKVHGSPVVSDWRRKNRGISRADRVRCHL